MFFEGDSGKDPIPILKSEAYWMMTKGNKKQWRQDAVLSSEKKLEPKRYRWNFPRTLFSTLAGHLAVSGDWDPAASARWGCLRENAHWADLTLPSFLISRVSWTSFTEFLIRSSFGLFQKVLLTCTLLYAPLSRKHLSSVFYHKTKHTPFRSMLE